MLLSTFETPLYYGQVAVFSSDLDNPYNDWTDDHVKQGFAWRDGSVSFGMTCSDDSVCSVTVRLTDTIEWPVGVTRAIAVPFFVGAAGIEVGSVSETVLLSIPAGNYELVLSVTDNASVDFTFRLCDDVEPRILKSDESIAGEVLVMGADAAV